MRLGYSHSFLAIAVLFSALTWTGCEKAITVELPNQQPYLVVEGRIETGLPPFVLLSQSQDYFAPIDASSLGSLYAGGAEVKLDVDGLEVDLIEVCTSELGPEELAAASELLGFPVEVLILSNLCVYTSFTILGEEGRTYALEAVLGEDTARAITKLNPPIALDSLWFEIPGNTDSLGVLHALFEDPDSLGNAYRWSAQRLGKDPTFLYPSVSTVEDAFFNGLAFEFTQFRPVTAADFEDDANPDEIGFYKTGDTVLVRWDHIDRGAYEAITSMEEQIQSQGSPFANPSDVATNVEGGLGLWVAYAPHVDTVICVP
jgi:hypothetical protein